MSGTIRQRLEAIRDRHAERFGIPYSANAAPRSLNQCTCGRTWPCSDHEHAVAALAILDNADECYGNEKTSPHPYWRLVWDADAIEADADPRGDS